MLLCSLVGSLNKIPLSIAGIILFKVPTSLPNLLSISFGNSLMQSFCIHFNCHYMLAIIFFTYIQVLCLFDLRGKIVFLIMFYGITQVFLREYSLLKQKCLDVMLILQCFVKGLGILKGPLYSRFRWWNI